MIFDPLQIHNVLFRNRVLRSSVGGRTCNYDGTVTDVWKNFEKRFADGGVAGIVSTTFHVNKERLSPLQYPSIAEDKYVPYLKKYIPQIKGGKYDTKYIVQIGDPGYTTYTSLLPEDKDELSSSGGFDLAFGYNNRRRAMTDADIVQSIADHAAAAARVRESGADGVEITATKGYLIHQFLNPGINLRRDDWGGDEERRFRFLERIMEAVRAKVGADFLVGVRLSGADYNHSPWPLALARFPPQFLSQERWHGNGFEQMGRYALRLETLGVNYLHVVSGYGFPNPHDVPGEFPFDEVRMFFDSVRHLSGKAAFRSTAFHVMPAPIGRWLLNIGWKGGSGVNLGFAEKFRRLVKIPIISNGGFQARAGIEDALAKGQCDMVSMARALIANHDLVGRYFDTGEVLPEKLHCSQCNRCVGRTTISPLGCYDLERFGFDKAAMLKEIFEWNRADPA